MTKQIRRLFLIWGLLTAGAWLQADTNIALGRPYTASKAASSSYPDTRGVELTNGVFAASADYSLPAWQGRTGTSYYHTVDLGAAKAVTRILTNFMSNTSVGISYPVSVACSYSKDNRTFTSLGNATGQAASGNRKKWQWSSTAITARYVRVTVKGSGNWIFQDEIEVWSPATDSAPSDLKYPQSSMLGTVGTPVDPNTPTVKGTVTTWSIAPPLPSGLSLSPANGTISGTPSISQASATYTIKAANDAGLFTTATLRITVNPAGTEGIPTPLSGVTLDEEWTEDPDNWPTIVEALRSCQTEKGFKPTVRIIMGNDDNGVPFSPSHYVPLFRTISEAKVAYILACPVDSTFMLLYTKDSYRQRFADSESALGDYVDLWEIGNEINGEGYSDPDEAAQNGEDPWMGYGEAARQANADKMIAAWECLHGRGRKTFLTPYYFKPGCNGPDGENSPTMEDWLRKYVPSNLKVGLDYVMLSYYEDDNANWVPTREQWTQVFADLQGIFPSARIGFGECGNTADKANLRSKLTMIHRYYQMPKYVTNYVGGYFWWNWAQDCVFGHLDDNGKQTVPAADRPKLWNALKDDMANQPK